VGGEVFGFCPSHLGVWRLAALRFLAVAPKLPIGAQGFGVRPRRDARRSEAERAVLRGLGSPGLRPSVGFAAHSSAMLVP